MDQILNIPLDIMRDCVLVPSIQLRKCQNLNVLRRVRYKGAERKPVLLSRATYNHVAFIHRQSYREQFKVKCLAQGNID